MLRSGVESDVIEVIDSAVLPAPIPYSPTPQALHRRNMQRLAARVATDLFPFDPPVFHHFADNVYGREMHILPGCTVVGRVHKRQNMMFMLQGACHFYDGQSSSFVRAPRIWVSPPGTQRAVFAVEHCIFVSVIGTDLRDPDEIFEEFTSVDADAYDQFLLEQQGAQFATALRLEEF